MTRHLFSTVVTIGLLAASSAHAGLIGQHVTGSLQFSGGGPNYFDPANPTVPAGYLNTSGPTVMIADPTLEFGHASSGGVEFADFTDSQLLVSDSSTIITTHAPWMMTFTSSTSGLFQALSLVSDDFSPGLTYGLTGNTITINWAGGPVFKGTSFRAIFDVQTAAVPEPNSLALAGLGLLSLGLALKRKA